MARHRALSTHVRRGVARWPIAVIGLVALIGLGWLGWSWLGGVLDRRAVVDAGNCGEGEAVLRIAVAPSAADPLRQAATNWMRGQPVVQDHCIRVEVQAIDSQTVLNGLTQNWDESKLGERPQAWLPESTLWVNRLAAQNNALVGSQPDSIASSPVVLAMPEQASQALLTGSAFRWSDLPDLTSDAKGWSRYGRADWGRFRIAMPDPATNPATAMGIQSALAGASPQGAGPVTVDMLSLPPVKDTMASMASTRTNDTPDTTREALTALAKVDDVSGATYDAVPAFESDLYRRNVGKDGQPAPRHPLFGVQAGGPSPTADYPFIATAGSWVSDAQVRAAQKFRDYLKEDAQQRDLAKAGLRTAAGKEHPNPSPGIRWSATTDNLVAADANTAQQISAAWANAASGGQVVTVLVDVSRSMIEDAGDGQSRLDWVKAALHGQVDRSVSGSIGLWEFSRSVDGDKPYKQLVQTGPVQQQRDALIAGIDQLRPFSATQLYTSLLATYRYAMDNYQDGRRNRIVVLTDGPNDGGLNYQQLRAELGKLKNDSKPMPISVVAIGPDPERGPITELARVTGGSVSFSLDGKGIDPALGQVLSTAR